MPNGKSIRDDVLRQFTAKLTNSGLSREDLLNLSRCYAWRAYWAEVAAHSHLVSGHCLPNLSPQVNWPEPPFSPLRLN